MGETGVRKRTVRQDQRQLKPLPATLFALAQTINHKPGTLNPKPNPYCLGSSDLGAAESPCSRGCAGPGRGGSRSVSFRILRRRNRSRLPPRMLCGIGHCRKSWKGCGGQRTRHDRPGFSARFKDTRRNSLRAFLAVGSPGTGILGGTLCGLLWACTLQALRHAWWESLWASLWVGSPDQARRPGGTPGEEASGKHLKAEQPHTEGEGKNNINYSTANLNLQPLKALSDRANQPTPISSISSESLKPTLTALFTSAFARSTAAWPKTHTTSTERS